MLYKRDLWGLCTRKDKILLQVGHKKQLSACRVAVPIFRDMGPLLRDRRARSVRRTPSRPTRWPHPLASKIRAVDHGSATVWVRDQRP